MQNSQSYKTYFCHYLDIVLLVDINFINVEFRVCEISQIVCSYTILSACISIITIRYFNHIPLLGEDYTTNTHLPEAVYILISHPNVTKLPYTSAISKSASASPAFTNSPPKDHLSPRFRLSLCATGMPMRTHASTLPMRLANTAR